jgi:hypothetical protein
MFAMIIFAITAAALIFLPDNAFAWGPGFHLQLGTMVLESVASFPPAVAAVIAAYPNDFLYGCIAADITLGKKYTHYLLNCHRWHIGKKLLAEAGEGAQQACAYGYLTHLAADAVSHNYYVPIKIMRSYPTLVLNHAYWEMRFDCYIPADIWELGRKAARENYEANDALLRRVISKTIFSFGTNKKIFNSILLVSRLEKWQQLLQTINDVSRFPLDEEARDDYLELAREAVFDILANGETSSWFAADPTGEGALRAAVTVRRNLRLLYQSGKITKADANSELEDIRLRLKAAIRHPEQLKQIQSG